MSSEEEEAPASCASPRGAPVFAAKGSGDIHNLDGQTRVGCLRSMIVCRVTFPSALSKTGVVAIDVANAAGLLK